MKGAIQPGRAMRSAVQPILKPDSLAIEAAAKAASATGGVRSAMMPK